jgi:hypothetical protein
VSCALWALDAATGDGDKLRVPFVEWSLFQEQENVVLYPLLQMPNREQNPFGLGSGSIPLFAEAIGECLFLFCWLQFGEQKRMAYADLLGIERLDDWRGKFRQPNSGGAICRALSDFCRDLLDAVLRVFQVEQGFESLDYASYCTSLLVGCTSWFADFPLRYLRSWLRSGELASGGS